MLHSPDSGGLLVSVHVSCAVGDKIRTGAGRQAEGTGAASLLRCFRPSKGQEVLARISVAGLNHVVVAPRVLVYMLSMSSSVSMVAEGTSVKLWSFEVQHQKHVRLYSPSSYFGLASTTQLQAKQSTNRRSDGAKFEKRETCQILLAYWRN